MYAVGLDVDTKALVSTELHLFIPTPPVVCPNGTGAEAGAGAGAGAGSLAQGKVAMDEWEKILLYAGNFSISSPLLFFRLGKIYFTSSEQSAGNFTFSTKATAVTKNTYNSYISLPKISAHVPAHNSNLTDLEFGFFLAGLIEGDGWFGLNQLHIVFSDRDISLAYLIKKRIGYGNIYKIKDKKA